VLASSEKYETTIAPVGPSTWKLEQPRAVTFRLKTDPGAMCGTALLQKKLFKCTRNLYSAPKRRECRAFAIRTWRLCC